MSSWTPILHAPSSSASSLSSTGVDETGVIVSWPDPFSPNVLVRFGPPRDSVISIFMPWADRPEMLDEFLKTSCDTFCISATVREQHRHADWQEEGSSNGHLHIAKYTVWVNETNLLKEMSENGVLRGECFALSVLRRFAAEAQLSSADGVFQLCLPDPPASCLLGWGSRPLYASQERSLKWMRAVERAVETGKNTLRYRLCVPLGTTGWAFDILNCMLRTDSSCTTLKARFLGGVLTNSVGTGKTVVALSLVSASQHMPSDPSEISSNATVVVVPHSLPLQWMEEVGKFCPGLRAICLSSMKEMRTSTLEEVVSADIVITTTNFLRNKAYLDSLDDVVRKTMGCSGVDRKESKRRGLILTCARVLHSRCRPLSSLPPLLELVQWRRLVIDEVHELTTPSSQLARERYRAIQNLRASLFWGLTGTPDTSSSASVQALYPLLLVPKTCDEVQVTHPCLELGVENGLMRRFSAETFSPSHLLHLVRLTAAERIAVQSFEDLSTPLCIEMCSCFGVGKRSEKRRVTVEEAVDELCREREGRIASLEAGEGDPSEEIASLRREMEWTRSRLASATEACPVCMESECDVMLSCGHTLCSSCSERIRSSSSCPLRCPVCRGEGGREFRIRSGEGGDPLSFGTKTSSIVRLVLSLVREEEEQVILFSQYRRLTESVFLSLEGEGVPSAVLDGTTSRRCSLLRRFREGGLRTLGVRLDKSVAGIDLTSARHVVFAHAVYAPTFEEAMRIEQQAVGRVARNGQTRSVHCHHFVVEDSQEEVLWRKRH